MFFRRRVPMYMTHFFCFIDIRMKALEDLVAQWLMGDELKQDQFKFFYDTVKIIYDCALRDKLLAADPEVINYVIPKLIAYRALM